MVFPKLLEDNEVARTARQPLGTRELLTPVSRVPLWAYNRLGAFDNLSDTEHGLREILSESFEAVDLDIVGSIAVFSATGSRHLSS